ncbi:MAG: nicotinate (nicotinamide) nucleotide adenylyltransferase [Bacteroidales bacterium]|nr:nicotinate (nicotinamide) nucleotide adenylyltransferase [Bacteroidales bacterium]
MKIAVYSGSFNPLHIGHLAIMEHLTLCMDFGKVYLVVSPKNPLKDGVQAASGRARYEAACEALARHPGLRVKADPVELRMRPPYYTIRTLDALRRREKENEFTLVIGGDQLADFRRWKDYGRILREYGVVVFPREGSDSAADRASLLAEDPSYRIVLADSFARVDVSSTQIREMLSLGADPSALLM